MSITDFWCRGTYVHYWFLMSCCFCYAVPARTVCTDSWKSPDKHLRNIDTWHTAHNTHSPQMAHYQNSGRRNSSIIGFWCCGAYAMMYLHGQSSVPYLEGLQYVDKGEIVPHCPPYLLFCQIAWCCCFVIAGAPRCTCALVSVHRCVRTCVPVPKLCTELLSTSQTLFHFVYACCTWCDMIRVGQSHIYTMYKRFFGREITKNTQSYVTYVVYICSSG